jgi:hypothetical protein
MGPLQDRPGEGVEDASAVPTSVVQDGFAMPAVDIEPVAGPAPRAGQAAGMEPAEQGPVAGRFIEQIDDGEVHG